MIEVTIDVNTLVLRINTTADNTKGLDILGVWGRRALKYPQITTNLILHMIQHIWTVHS